MLRRTFFAFAIGFVLPLRVQDGQPRSLRVAAASDLHGVFQKIQAAFDKAHPGSPVLPTFGASGALLAQVRQGAPFDLYLAADLNFPQQLVQDGLADGVVFPYAEGRLALWTRKELALRTAEEGLRVLQDPRVKRVAIANPAVAPYGRAALAALGRAGLGIDGKLLRGENVAQAAQYLQAGAAEAGLISLTQARHPALQASGAVWVLPAEAYPALVQGGVVLKRSPALEQARRFRDFLTGPEGRAILAQEGYGLP